MVRKARVLLVDDSHTDTKLFQVAASRSQWIDEVRVANDGQQALQILKSEDWQPHLIFLDLNMPRMNGLEFLEHSKQDPQLRKIPTIMLTTSAAREDVMAAYDRHSNSYLTKPPDFPGFERMLKKVEEYWFQLADIPTDI